MEQAASNVEATVNKLKLQVSIPILSQQESKATFQFPADVTEKEVPSILTISTNTIFSSISAVLSVLPKILYRRYMGGGGNLGVWGEF